MGMSLLLVTLGSCSPLVGGGVLLGAVAMGALTARCYDYVDVTVLDADGRKTCAATVTASSGGSEFELSSCYQAPLTNGKWELRATLAGSIDAVSTVLVEHPHDCIRYVQSVELTLHRPGAAPARPLTPPALAPLPLSPSASSPPPPASPSATPPTSATGEGPTPSPELSPERSQPPP